jgi:hypothetical protein
MALCSVIIQHWIYLSAVCLWEVWSLNIETESIHQMNSTTQGRGCNGHVPTCHCTSRRVYSSFHTSSRSWSAFKVSLLLLLADLTTSESTEQRACIRLHKMIGKTAAETSSVDANSFRRAEHDFLSGSVALKWHECPSVCRNDALHGLLSTRRNDESIAQLYDLVWNGRGLARHEMAEDVGISHSSCQSILAEDLGKRHVSAKFLS